MQGVQLPTYKVYKASFKCFVGKGKERKEFEAPFAYYFRAYNRKRVEEVIHKYLPEGYELKSIDVYGDATRWADRVICKPHPEHKAICLLENSEIN